MHFIIETLYKELCLMFHELLKIVIKIKGSTSSIIQYAVFYDRLRNAVILCELCKSFMSRE